MKLFRKKAQNRKVFGFNCDQSLAQGVRLTARAIEFPIYVVAEHALQIGMATIAPILGDEKAREELEYHLQADHLLQKNLVQPITDYDRRLLAGKKQDVIRNLIEEKKEDADVIDATKFFFALSKMFDAPPAYLLGFLQDILLRNRFPKDWNQPYDPNRGIRFNLNSQEEDFGDKNDPEEE